MTRGRTRSRLSLSERREEASALFLKGFSITEVSERLHVSWDTAKSYKQWHEDRLAAEAATQPQLLSDVLKNTIQMLAELDQIRAAAWRQYHTSESKQTRLQALNTVRSCNQDKSKLFGLFGVKQEVYANLALVKAVQDMIIEFLSRELCDEDQAKFLSFLAKPELQQYMGMPALPMLELESEEIDADEANVA